MDLHIYTSTTEALSFHVHIHLQHITTQEQSNTAIELPCMKLLPTACMPTGAMPKSVGLDLYSPTSVLIPAHNQVLIGHGNCFSNSHGSLWSNSP